MNGAPPKSSMATSFTGDGYGVERPGRRYRACTPPDPERHRFYQELEPSNLMVAAG
jgi:hypothetical protein